jgi:hypothetical protein
VLEFIRQVASLFFSHILLSALISLVILVGGVLWAVSCTPAVPAMDAAAVPLNGLTQEELMRLATQQLPGDEEVVATVNGEPITRGEVRRVAFAMRSNQPDLSEAEARKRAFHEAAKRAAARAEALRLGLEPSAEEIDAAVRFLREQWLKAPPEQRAVLEEDIRQSGLSEEEYWERFREQHARAALPGKLAQWRAEQAAKARPLAQPSPFEDYLEELLGRARVEYLDGSFR